MSFEGHVLHLLKCLREVLNNNAKAYAEKVDILVLTWGRIATSKQQKPLAAMCIGEIIYKDTLDIVLQGKWPKMSPSSKMILIQMLIKCQTDLFKDHPHIQTKFSKLIELVNDPWTLPILQSVLHNTPIPPTEEQIEQFLVSEKSLVIVTRIEMLCANKCDQVAVQLAETCYNGLNAPNARIRDLYTVEEYNFILDIYLCLLYKYQKIESIINLLKVVSVKDGYNIILRLKKRCNLSKIKVWKVSPQVSEVVARYFITVSMVSRVSYPTLFKNLIREWLTYFISRDAENRLIDEVRKITQSCIMSEHIYYITEILKDVAEERESQQIRSLIMELFIRAITSDINYLERVKIMSNQQQITECEKQLASKFLMLAELIKDHAGVRREFVLTAFSIHPTQEIYQRVEKEAIASGKAMPNNICTNNNSNNCHENLDGGLSEGISSISSEETDAKDASLDYSANNDSQDSGTFTEVSNRCTLHLPYDGLTPVGELCFQCGDFTGISTMPCSPGSQAEAKKERELDALILIKGNTVTESSNYDVLAAPSQVLEAEKLGLSSQVCADLATLLGSHRYHLLTWMLEWSELSTRCQRYIDEADAIKNGNKELKFLDIDYNQYKHWPANEDEYDCIEKGYEQWLEDTSETDDIVQAEDKRSSHSTDSEDAMIKLAIKRSQKHTGGRYAESSTDSDSSSTRKRSKHRMKKVKKRTKSDKDIDSYCDFVVKEENKTKRISKGRDSDNIYNQDQRQKKFKVKVPSNPKSIHNLVQEQQINLKNGTKPKKGRTKRLSAETRVGSIGKIPHNELKVHSESLLHSRVLPDSVSVKSDPFVIKSLRAYRPNFHKVKLEDPYLQTGTTSRPGPGHTNNQLGCLVMNRLPMVKQELDNTGVKKLNCTSDTTFINRINMIDNIKFNNKEVKRKDLYKATLLAKMPMTFKDLFSVSNISPTRNTATVNVVHVNAKAGNKPNLNTNTVNTSIPSTSASSSTSNVIKKPDTLVTNNQGSPNVKLKQSTPSQGTSPSNNVIITSSASVTTTTSSTQQVQYVNILQGNPLGGPSNLRSNAVNLVNVIGNSSVNNLSCQSSQSASIDQFNNDYVRVLKHSDTSLTRIAKRTVISTVPDIPSPCVPLRKSTNFSEQNISEHPISTTVSRNQVNQKLFDKFHQSNNSNSSQAFSSQNVPTTNQSSQSALNTSRRIPTGVNIVVKDQFQNYVGVVAESNSSQVIIKSNPSMPSPGTTLKPGAPITVGMKELQKISQSATIFVHRSEMKQIYPNSINPDEKNKSTQILNPPGTSAPSTLLSTVWMQSSRPHLVNSSTASGHNNAQYTHINSNISTTNEQLRIKRNSTTQDQADHFLVHPLPDVRSVLDSTSGIANVTDNNNSTQTNSSNRQLSEGTDQHVIVQMSKTITPSQQSTISTTTNQAVGITVGDEDKKQLPKKKISIFGPSEVEQWLVGLGDPQRGRKNIVIQSETVKTAIIPEKNNDGTQIFEIETTGKPQAAGKESKSEKYYILVPEPSLSSSLPKFNQAFGKSYQSKRIPNETNETVQQEEKCDKPCRVNIETNHLISKTKTNEKVEVQTLKTSSKPAETIGPVNSELVPSITLPSNYQHIQQVGRTSVVQQTSQKAVTTIVSSENPSNMPRTASTLIYTTRPQGQLVLGRMNNPTMNTGTSMVYTQQQPLLITTVPSGSRTVLPGTQLVRLPNTSSVWRMTPGSNSSKILQIAQVTRPHNLILQNSQEQGIINQSVLLQHVTTLPIKPISVVVSETKTEVVDTNKVETKDKKTGLEDDSSALVATPELETVALMKDIKEFENVFEETKLKFEMEEQQSSGLPESDTVKISTMSVAEQPSIHQPVLLQPPLMLHKPHMIITSPTTQATVFTQKQNNLFPEKEVEKRLILTTKPKHLNIEETSHASHVTVAYVSHQPPTPLSQQPLVVVTSYGQAPVSPAASVTSQSSSSPNSVIASVNSASKNCSKSKPRSIKTIPSAAKSPPTAKPQQKPQEDASTAQKIFAILEEYAEQLRNSPDVNNRPAPRRRSNPPANSNPKRKKTNCKNKESFSDGDEGSFSEEIVPSSEDSSNGVAVLQICVSSSSSH